MLSLNISYRLQHRQLLFATPNRFNQKPFTALSNRCLNINANMMIKMRLTIKYLITALVHKNKNKTIRRVLLPILQNSLKIITDYFFLRFSPNQINFLTYNQTETSILLIYEYPNICISTISKYFKFGIQTKKFNCEYLIEQLVNLIITFILTNFYKHCLVIIQSDELVNTVLWY